MWLQCLFSWLYYCNRVRLQKARRNRGSFNACFPGSITATCQSYIPYNRMAIASMLVFLALLLQPRAERRGGGRMMKLQCLFSWLYYCNNKKPRREIRDTEASMLVFLALLLQPFEYETCISGGECFNACFPGSITATMTRISPTSYPFQSFNACFPGSITATFP